MKPKMGLNEDSIELHRKHKGKVAIVSKTPLKTKHDLSIAYTPGVAEPCRQIAKDKKLVYDYTFKGNTVAVVSDGSAVLGLGNIGAEAGLPVMEGKAILMKEFGNLDAFPICVSTQKSEDIIQLVEWIEPVFGAINLEDISAPRCFEVEDALKEKLSIPVFHDDQHGTAIVVLAGMINAAKIAGKKFSDLKAVMCGAGAAGIAVSKILLNYGIGDIILCDSKGIVHEGRNDLNKYKQIMAKETNKDNKTGDLAEALKGADVFIGVSVAGIVTKEMVASMNDTPIILAMANPIPEIMPEEVLEVKSDAIIGTGRSDFPNQVNNVLAFPGVLRGALDAKATDITEGMKLAAAEALAAYVKEPSREQFIPDPLDKNVSLKVAEAVKNKAIEEGVVRKE